MHDHPDLHLSCMYERDWTTFRLPFIKETEARLEALPISPNPIADGDVPIDDCRYASLRNEAFVNGVYPPNEAGWKVEACLAMLIYPHTAHAHQI